MMKKLSRRSFLQASGVLAAMAALTACGGSQTETGKTADAHEAITFMAPYKEIEAFIEQVHSVYPEVNIEVVPYEPHRDRAADPQGDRESLPHHHPDRLRLGGHRGRGPRCRSDRVLRKAAGRPAPAARPRRCPEKITPKKPKRPELCVAQGSGRLWSYSVLGARKQDRITSPVPRWSAPRTRRPSARPWCSSWHRRSQCRQCRCRSAPALGRCPSPQPLPGRAALRGHTR